MKNNLLVLGISLLLLSSCGERKTFRSPTPGFGFTNRTSEIDESSLEYQMEMALLITDDEERYKRVEELLKQGADPDKMTGQFKWIDTNPLWECCANTKLAELLISYGADVKKRPYIAKLISYVDLADKNPDKEREDFYKEHPQSSATYEHDVYKSVKLLLERGADPNLKCIYGERVLFPATDWNYRRYFNKYGKSAINYCIEENYLLLFPLLIEYGALLDNDSLKLAAETTERTGSTEMEELVKKQWEIQSQLH
ncbi:MAG: ankyrin repeat domain-containing protein [Treponema sp.]